MTPRLGRSPAARVALCGALAAAAMLLSFLESLVPLPLPVPGLKIGLANIATLAALYYLRLPDAAAVVAVRCALSALLFGGLSALPFSLGGGLCALLAMAAVRRSAAFSVFGVGIAGAAAHNAAQIAAAALIYRTPAPLIYLAALLPLSIVTGSLVALIFRFFSKYFPRLR